LGAAGGSAPAGGPALALVASRTALLTSNRLATAGLLGLVGAGGNVHAGPDALERFPGERPEVVFGGAGGVVPAAVAGERRALALGVADPAVVADQGGEHLDAIGLQLPLHVDGFGQRPRPHPGQHHAVGDAGGHDHVQHERHHGFEVVVDSASCDIIAIMSDILIRDVPEHTVAEIDRRASESGMSRNEYLRHWLGREIRPQVSVTDDDLDRLSMLAGDVTDPYVMRQAWS
jgi:hypothetical protein